MQLFFDLEDCDKLTQCINNMVRKNVDREIVFLCIGTQKVVGDSFGPITGQMLSQAYENVYGSLYKTVNATNIKDEIENIYSNYYDPYIIVLDSALGEKNITNKIVIGSGGINPGSALNKIIDMVGDMYINAIVGEYGKYNFEELKNVKLDNVLKLSVSVFTAINNSICLKRNTIVNNHIK